MTLRKIRIEASSVCQLKCPSCPTGIGTLRESAVGSGYLTLDRLRRILDGADWVELIELSNWGEVFLNKELVEILQYTEGRGIQVTIHNGVNLNDAKDEALEAVVKYGVRHLKCSIDGASQETYSQYRRGGNYHNVIRNVRRLLEFKRKYNSEYPRLIWQFVVFGHNEHELTKAKQLAQELGMEFRAKLNWDETYSPVVDAEFVKSQTDLKHTSRTEFKSDTGLDYKRSTCLQLWKEPQVNHDGKVLGCCINTWGHFGDSCEEDLNTVLNGPKMNRARQMLMGRAPALEGIPCTRCHYFEDMARTSSWITSEEIEEYEPHM